MTDLILTSPALAEQVPYTLMERIVRHVDAHLPANCEHVAATRLLVGFLETTPLAPALDGEPLFVLRAADKVAPFIVHKWADEAEHHGAPKAKVDGADLIATQMIGWQMAHPGRAKYPD